MKEKSIVFTYFSTCSNAVIWIFCLILFTFCTRKAILIAPREYYTKPVFESENSIINLIVEFPTVETAQFLDSKLPDLLYEDNNIEDDNYTLKVLKRSSLILEPQGEYIYFTAPLKVEAKAKLNVGFISAEQSGTFDLDVKFRLRLGLTKNWEITTEATPAGYKWITEPKVKMGPFEISVAPFLDKILVAQQTKIALQIDSLAKSAINFKPLVDEAWRYIQNPIPVSESINAWTKVQPSAIYFVPIAGTQENIKLGIGIKAKIETTIGNKPAFDNTALPALSQGVLSDSLFEIQLVSKIGFKEASTFAKQQLSQTPFSFENEKYKANINDLSFYGSGEKLIVKSLLSGDYNGFIYFYGIPYFDSTSNTVRIKNLDFSYESNQTLKKTYSWLFKGLLLNKINKQLEFSINNKAKNASQILTDYLNNLKPAPGITINAKITSLTPNKILIDDGQLVFNLLAKGKIAFRVNLMDR
ncbi:MAG: DUF4403 family protein [Cytophagales bacterium]